MTEEKNVSSDRKRVAAGQDYEVKYAARKSGASTDDVKQAIKAAGNSRAMVEEKLDRRPK